MKIVVDGNVPEGVLMALKSEPSSPIISVAGEGGVCIHHKQACDMCKHPAGLYPPNVPLPELEGPLLVDSLTPSMKDVLAAVELERERQDAKWGEQNHPDFYQVEDLQTGTVLGPMPLPQRFNYYGLPTEEDAKADCDKTFKRGKGNWGHILVEEISESFGTTSEEKLEEELIQSAAVIVAWVQCIRRRRANR